jgi:hypothetical protein
VSLLHSLVHTTNISLKIKRLSSSPYYTQANGLAESSNKTIIKLIKKKIEENPKRWHEVLSGALWAHRIFKHSAIKVTPFELVYEQEAILPMEVNLDTLRIASQNELSAIDYDNLMLDRLDEVSDERELEPTIRDSRKNRFKSETLFARRFCLLGLGATSLGSGRQIGKDHIRLRK